MRGTWRVKRWLKQVDSKAEGALWLRGVLHSVLGRFHRRKSKMTQAVRYFTEVLSDGHIPLPPEIDREKIRPGSTVEVILMMEDDSQRELEALLASFRRGTGDFSEQEVGDIVNEAVAAVRKAEFLSHIRG